jgi:hypothetical protein
MNDTPAIVNASTYKEQDDYTQSANTLFHFMMQKEFLEGALYRKALVPRFCREDISYLNISVNGQKFEEVAILQKCFCDIPLHKITAKFDCVLTEESRKEFKDLFAYDHTEYYGPYAIAFSKKWCEEHNLQPIHYLNDKSTYTREFKLFIERLVCANDLPDEFAIDILQRLALVKPLRGKMKRNFDIKKEVNLIKNFHDEQEWRFIPDLSKIKEVNSNSTYKYQPLIANPYLLNEQASPEISFIDTQSNELEKEKYKSLWLNFTYNDIRYIIVPDKQSRIDIIDFIMELPKSNLDESEKISLIQYLLISKILVLDEIRKDW